MHCLGMAIRKNHEDFLSFAVFVFSYLILPVCLLGVPFEILDVGSVDLSQDF